MSDEKSHLAACVLSAFVVGSLLGAGLALLCAPGAGSETRNRLARRICDVKDQAGGTLADAMELVRDTKADIQAAVVAGQEAIREKRVRRGTSA